RRNQLLRHKDAALRGRAEIVFKSLRGGNRQKVYEEYKSILTLTPDATNGQSVFKRVCAQCHTHAGQGAAVGPDLTGVRNQRTDVLLLHILVPSSEIDAGYQAYVVETEDGRVLSGLIASETATSLTLRRALGEQETILRSNIASISASKLSL